MRGTEESLRRGYGRDCSHTYQLRLDGDVLAVCETSLFGFRRQTFGTHMKTLMTLTTHQGEEATHRFNVRFAIRRRASARVRLGLHLVVDRGKTKPTFGNAFSTWWDSWCRRVFCEDLGMVCQDNLE